MAEANGVDIVTVLNERDELNAAARIGRALVAAKRQEDQQSR